MNTFSDFSEYYRTISDAELVAILDNPADYQPLAVEAAKAEFDSRQLSEEALQDAKTKAEGFKSKENEQLKQVEKKVQVTGRWLLSTLNPVQPGIPSTEKTIRLIIVVFSGLFLYQFFSKIKMHIAFLKDFPAFPVQISLMFFPLIILPIALVLFWKRKSMGWTLFVIYLTYSTIVAAIVLVQAFFWKAYESELANVAFPRPDIVSSLLVFLFFGGALYVLCKENIRMVYTITSQKIVVPIIVTLLIMIILVVARF